ncbi:hypothetical protein V1508DRAFT_439754 [Lipomyces doorenjongii]|uniref:uncharacterized protein n=1 Tax=Lipomyces doorenjongii TaxID=383834 RepID=UPI0034CD09CF
MSDPDCEISSVSWTDELSVGLSKRAPRFHRIDYHLTHDGNDEEAALEGRNCEDSVNLPLEDSEPITSNDLVIQLIQESDTLTCTPVADARDAGFPQKQALSVADLSDTYGLADRSSTPQVKSHNLLLWS